MANCAENLPGLSKLPKTRLSRLWRDGVGEHFKCVEAPAVRRGGALGRENVGMSNHNPAEKAGPRKSKVSSAMEINGGLGGPKAMAKAAANGQLVNIPVLPLKSME